jgi:trimeric autotransporter adhesin
MAVSTDGKLTVAHSIRVGHGESDTTVPGATYRLDVSGDIGATGNITAYYSDERLKTKLGNISKAVDIIKYLNGFRYINNETAKSFGYDSDKIQVGVSAQEVERVLPEIVSIAPFDAAADSEGNIISKTGNNYKTVDYSKLVPVLIEAIKEQQEQIETLRKEINILKGVN